MFSILLANFSTIAAVTNCSLPPKAYLTLSFISSTEGIFFPMFQESWYCAYPLCHSRCIIYISNPTSNHNVVACEKAADRLYIFWFLHQTTTVVVVNKLRRELYIFWFLHQTTTWCCKILRHLQLYIFWFLHQTTTKLHLEESHSSCISFDSYIKPQPSSFPFPHSLVVYLLIPTSNHNV